MDFLGIGVLIVVTVLVSIVFWALLQNSVIINPSLMGLFSWWLSCVIGTGVVIFLAFNMVAGAISWIFDFIKEYYMYIIGAVVVLIGISVLGGKSKNA